MKAIITFILNNITNSSTNFSDKRIVLTCDITYSYCENVFPKCSDFWPKAWLKKYDKDGPIYARLSEWWAHSTRCAFSS